ncbi:hypothetical protein CEUSTIGMA_g11872.t1 [Chlamydomonas eustigma]|uniref:Uncharacterized protein n=1 Tax=Chlamydomonas eustigma TaxID=1157962 RepID=A0A250XNG1_9CHLO|nr:hypothetical protein CEUSTIGMA_g11872.t1 [Chlamydomonas eustigma]|eukprot:GAX84452.1 hypothetical protein CEUSTIGMA_g11872.t1 [Chlamydomonas eustigma]
MKSVSVSVSVAKDPKEGFKEEEILEVTRYLEEQEGLHIHTNAIVTTKPDVVELTEMIDLGCSSSEQHPLAKSEVAEEVEESNGERGVAIRIVAIRIMKMLQGRGMEIMTSVLRDSDFRGVDLMGEHEAGWQATNTVEEAAAAAIAAVDVEDKHCDTMQTGQGHSQDMVAQRSLSRGLVRTLSAAPRCNPWAPLAGPEPNAIALQNLVEIILKSDERGSLMTVDSMRGR